jgi:hypothetical protein
VLVYPEDALRTKSAEYVAGATMHEASHRDASWVDHFMCETDSRRLPLNAIEDPRVNNWMMAKVPSLKRYLDALCHDLYAAGEGGSFERAAAMPHIQFSLGVIHYWYLGREHPGIKNTRVLEALKETREAVVEAYNASPGTVAVTRYDEFRLVVSSPQAGRRIVNLPEVGHTNHYARSDILSLERVDDQTLNIVTARGQESVRIPESRTPTHLLVNLRPGVEEKKHAATMSARIIKMKVLPVYEKLVDESREQAQRQILDAARGRLSNSAGPVPGWPFG